MRGVCWREMTPHSSVMDEAIFACGCFWGVEVAFRNIVGVVDVRCGYTGGTLPNPTYKSVCAGKTGHAEAVKVTFDPTVVSYEHLVDSFWKMHDPSHGGVQSHKKDQYRSELFYATPEQQRIATVSREKWIVHSGKDVTTPLTKASAFYDAEEYHQNYHAKHKQ
jgi:methionine-S-sulfoxide reductase